MKRKTDRQPGSPGSPRGFTIMELMVAIGVATVMLFLMNRIFTSSSEVVSTGTAVSKTTSDGRTVSDVIVEDAGNLLGPADGGFLVIINHIYEREGQITRPNYRRMIVLTREGPDESDDVAVRSDQIVFIRHASGLTPLCPERRNTYSNTLAGAYAKVWYGHLQRLNADRTDPPLPQSLRPAQQLGEPTGHDQVATNWLLGRQAIILGGTNQNILVAHTAQYNAQIRLGQDRGWWPNYYALSDTAGLTLDDIVGVSAVVGDEPSRPLATGFGYGGTYNINALDPDDPGNPGDASDQPTILVTNTNYKAQAYRYTYAIERLRTNINSGDPSYDFSFHSDQIAQMHPLLAPNVSDFIVEFAADIYQQNMIDVGPDGELDIDLAVTTGVDVNGDPIDYPGGNIRWYAHNDDPFTNDPNDVDDSNDPDDGYDPSKPAVYGVPDASDYPPYDDSPAPVLATGAFVWPHDDHHFDPNNPAVSSRWPYLIRIRYRVHDERGYIGTRDEPGKWFENIIKVQRPS